MPRRTIARPHSTPMPRRARTAGWIATVLVLWLAFATGQATATTGGDGAAPTRLKQSLQALYDAQEPSGRFKPAVSRTLDRYPLIATMGWHSFRSDGDLSFLLASYEAASRYAAYLVANQDSDGDFLIERTTAPSRVPGGAEGAGYNALLALDLGVLSRMCVELNRPMESLYWYQGMKTMVRATIARTYKSTAGFFFPEDDRAAGSARVFLALSPVPASFRDDLGDNLSQSVILNYVLKAASLQPESPAHYLSSTLLPDMIAADGWPDAPVRAAALLNLLRAGGMGPVADARAAELRDVMLAIDRHNRQREADALALASLALVTVSGSAEPWLPVHGDLSVLVAVAGLPDVMESDERDRLAVAVDQLSRFVAAPQTSTDDDAVMRAVREVYWAISALRERWRTRTLLRPHERQQLPGFDAYAAISDLFEDAIVTLRRIETDLGHIAARRTGFQLGATLTSEATTPGEPLSMRFTLTSLREPMVIRSLAVIDGDHVDSLVTSRRPLRLAPGEPGAEYRYQLRGDVANLGLIPASLTADIGFADGTRRRYHFHRRAWVDPPVTFAVAYPKGRHLRGRTVPLELMIQKRAMRAVDVAAEWYSPASLALREGRSLALQLPEGPRAVTIPMNVTVPTPCRPGAFPYVLKVFGNGNSAGTVHDALFRHYNWLHIGPFPRGRGLDMPHPPERAIELSGRYRGAAGTLSWKQLVPRAEREDGWIDLTGTQTDGGTLYLYTSLGAPEDVRVPLVFGASAPALVIVNGRVTARFDDATADAPRQTNITLSRGANNILIKLLGSNHNRVFVSIGEPDGLTTDAFNNNLADLIDGYETFAASTRIRDRAAEANRVVTFTYENASAQSVAVIGTFNAWSPANAIMRSAGRGRWEIDLHLAPGRYVYRFLIDDRNQVLDPNTREREPDGYGGENSVLVVR